MTLARRDFLKSIPSALGLGAITSYGKPIVEEYLEKKSPLAGTSAQTGSEPKQRRNELRRSLLPPQVGSMQLPPVTSTNVMDFVLGTNLGLFGYFLVKKEKEAKRLSTDLAQLRAN